MSKVICIFSGGMDSITLLNVLKKENNQVYGMTFDYGQRHKKEIEFAELWAARLCEDWKLINLDFMKDIANNSALLDSAKQMPTEHYTNENQKITVVPNRNMVMLSIAVAWAENFGINKVFFGPHANDNAIYPDCRPGFVEALTKASVLGTYNNVEVIAPFIYKSKADIAKIGTGIGIDYSETWSCYEGKEKHCGRCATCQERKEAFILNGIKDPTEYK